MTQKEFIEELAVVLNEEPRNVTADTEVASLEGWDSMGLLSVVALLDGLLGTPLDVDRLQQCATVKDLIDMVKDRLG